MMGAGCCQDRRSVDFIVAVGHCLRGCRHYAGTGLDDDAHVSPGSVCDAGPGDRGNPCRARARRLACRTAVQEYRDSGRTAVFLGAGTGAYPLDRKIES